MKSIIKICLLIICFLTSLSGYTSEVKVNILANSIEQSYLTNTTEEGFIEFTTNKNYTIVARNTRNEEISVSDDKSNNYNNTFYKKNSLFENNVDINVISTITYNKFRTTHKISPILEYAILERAP